MSDLIRAVAEGDRARAEILARSFELDEYETWFSEIFGAQLGPPLAEGYAPVSGQFSQLVDLIASLQAGQQIEISVEQYDTPDDPAAVAYQSLAIRRMIRHTPLYSVRLSDTSGNRTFHLWSFVYHEGLFRWIGKTRALADKPSTGDLDLREYRIRDRKKARDRLLR